MPLSKFEGEAVLKAVRRFTNRENEFDVFSRSLSSSKSDLTQLKVVSFYGVGGVGKTRLLAKLINQVRESDSDQIQAHLIQIQALEFESVPVILATVRNALNIDASLFDYAFLEYWQRLGFGEDRLKKTGLGADSVVWEILEYVGGLASPFLSPKLIRKILERLRKSVLERYSDYAALIQEIPDFRDEELAERLPHFLGLCIRKRLVEKNELLVLFVDSLERLWARDATDGSAEWKATEWLRELIGSCERGLFIIGSREYLRWADRDHDWKEVLEQHILGNLSDRDANFFLSRVPISDPELRKEIVKTAGGLPLHLDLCVTIYVRRKSEGLTTEPQDFRRIRGEVVHAFINHLAPQEKEAVFALSLMQHFDEGLFVSVLNSLNVGVSARGFEEFTKLSIVSVPPESGRRFSIHQNLREHIRLHSDGKFHRTVIRALETAIKQRLLEADFSNASIDFKQLVSLSVSLEITDLPDIGHVLDFGFELIDRGYWIEVRDSCEDARVRLIKTKALSYLAGIELLLALGLRRTRKLPNAYEILKGLSRNWDVLGRHKLTGEFEYANVIRLLGDYHRAEQLYRKLLDKSVANQLNPELTVRVKRQFADLLMLNGRHVEANELINKLISDSKSSDLQTAESYRIRGHIQRFSFQFSHAIDSYKTALRYAEVLGAQSLIGKLQTNFAETWAWQDESKALAAGHQALKLNGELEALIEVGKAHAALALALYLHSGSLDKAKFHAAQAISLQKKTGYESGRLFGFVANSINAYLQQDKVDIELTTNSVIETIRFLKVYEFLALPIAVASDSPEWIAEIKDSVDWINFDETLSEIRRCLSKSQGNLSD